MAGIENMNFGTPHHGGMPSAEELRWRQAVERAEYVARYGEPVVKVRTSTPETIATEPKVTLGSIANFRGPGMSLKAYVQMTERADRDWKDRIV